MPESSGVEPPSDRRRLDSERRFLFSLAFRAHVGADFVVQGLMPYRPGDSGTCLCDGQFLDPTITFTMAYGFKNEPAKPHMRLAWDSKYPKAAPVDILKAPK